MVADSDAALRRRELRQAVKDLSERGLYTSAKWAAEQLVGLPGDTGAGDAKASSSSCGPSTSAAADEDDSDEYLLARTHFDLKVCFWV